MKQISSYFLAFVLLALSAIAAELKVGSLNCYLFFDPAIDHPGKVDDEHRMSAEQYRSKIENLATLTAGYNIVALQETGGRPEVSALATAAHMQWVWTRGNDTATGEEVAILYDLPGWQVTAMGRVSELDRVVSKHVLLRAAQGKHTIYVLGVHLIRPIGAQAEKQARQLAAIKEWVQHLVSREPGSSVLVVGDTNSTVTRSGVSLFGIGREANELNGFAATHLAGKCFDRLVLAGTGSWTGIEIRRPPYGKRPNNLLTQVWTDHFFIGASLRLD